jgi:hypothetical protein
MKLRLFLVALFVSLVFLVFTNPTESQFRAHIQEKEGLAGWLGLKMADLLSTGPQAGIRRENYFVCSRFYMGGDGILPRQDLAWGVAGRFIETAEMREGKKRE